MAGHALPQVDYAHTSRRPAWTQLPAPVQDAVGRLAGGRVAAADRPVSTGFSGSYAGRVLRTDGQAFFVKAAAPDQPHSVAALDQEAQVLPRLPEGIPAPGLVGFAAVEGWTVLVLDVVAGRMPGAPWTAAEVEAVQRACLTMAELGTPSTLGERDLGHRMTTDPGVLAVGRALAGSAYEPGPDLPPWFARHQHRVGTLVLSAGARFAGDTICHGDLRPDNLLVDLHANRGPVSSRATVVDWNWVGTAAPWVDWVGLLPLMAAQGVDVDTLVARSPLTRDADPDDLDAFLAVIVAYMLTELRHPAPPGCLPVLRRHQALMASVFLELLRHRRHWGS